MRRGACCRVKRGRQEAESNREEVDEVPSAWRGRDRRRFCGGWSGRAVEAASRIWGQGEVAFRTMGVGGLLRLRLRVYLGISQHRLDFAAEARLVERLTAGRRAQAPPPRGRPRQDSNGQCLWRGRQDERAGEGVILVVDMDNCGGGFWGDSHGRISLSEGKSGRSVAAGPRGRTSQTARLVWDWCGGRPTGLTSKCDGIARFVILGVCGLFRGFGEGWYSGTGRDGIRKDGEKILLWLR
jgi:hypothetical protein